MKSRNIIIAAVALLLMAGWANAQEYKVAKSTGRLEIHLGRVTIEGHSGNEIIFTSKNYKNERDPREDGLRSINSLGLEDNTGLGIYVQDKGNIVEVYQLKKTSSPDIKILVPKSMIVSVSHESQYGGEIKFKNIDNEIEVSTQYNSVELDNVTGPLTIKTIYGHVEAVFGATIKDPVSIVSVYGYVDVTLPQATKANMKLSTSYGEILVAPELKLEVSPSGKYSDRISGTLNGGGGVNIDLSCNYGKVYLRKK
jgi:hypothetical protein